MQFLILPLIHCSSIAKFVEQVISSREHESSAYIADLIDVLDALKSLLWSEEPVLLINAAGVLRNLISKPSEVAT